MGEARARGIFGQDLDPSPANFVPLSPLSLLKRSASVYPEKIAVLHDRAYSYREFYARCRRLASALAQRGIGKGDTVSIFAPNIPAMLEAHFGVAMAGAVLNSINTRLDPATTAFILAHGESKLLLADSEFAPVVRSALEEMESPPPVIEIVDPLGPGAMGLSETDYESFLEGGDPDCDWSLPEDEWDAICLNYTSGTTGNPKGVVYHHRGAHLNALGNLVSFGITQETRYLWTLPMFHCNGWTFTWAVTAAAGTHVCLRKVDPAVIYPRIRDAKVTLLCGAPIVLTLLAYAPAEAKVAFDHEVRVVTGGAAPTSTIIRKMEALGFSITHAYGLTECYGPSTFCAWQEGWDSLPLEERTTIMARQGVGHITVEEATVLDPETMKEVPRDGATIGELMLRGNTLMKGYLKNAKATGEAFAGDWFHTGDLAVLHPDGYIEVKDRAKDIIISGGENISSLEVEEVLYKHPKIMEAAVVARPDETWGETPCAFITLVEDESAAAEEIIEFCRQNLARYKVPRSVIFGELPKTSTGKIQKFVLRARAKEF